MKWVILVQNLSVGGIQRLVVDDANELVRRGHEVYVVTFEPKQEGDSMSDLLRVPASHILTIPYPRLRSLSGLIQLIRQLRRIRPDAVMTHHWFANTVGRVAARCAGVKNVLSFEHSTYDTRKSEKQFILDRLLQGWSRYIVVVSESVRDSLIAHGIQPNRIRVVGNGIDLSGFSRRGLRTQEPISFLFVGRLIDDKNVDVLLEALAGVPNCALRIVGDGPERVRLVEQVGRLGITDRVAFLGIRQDIASLLTDTDALVLPSCREGFGLVLLEALASGVPVIASDLPAIASIVRDRVDGLLVTPSDSGTLRDALSRFTTDTNLRTRLQEAAGKDMTRFSIEAHVDTLLELVAS